ncbi:MAG: hypothetical protein ACRELF_22885, partial [Gemmataceae bacterium]
MVCRLIEVFLFGKQGIEDGMKNLSACLVGVIVVLASTAQARAGDDSLTLKGHTRWIGGVAFAPNGEIVASAS